MRKCATLIWAAIEGIRGCEGSPVSDVDNLFNILADILHKPVANHCFHRLMFSTVNVEPPVENMVALGAAP
ncbi:hypothetical protein ACVWZT_002272 [Pseudomonas sp. TE21394]